MTIDIERLISCALIRDGEVHSRGFKEHWSIRAALGDADPYQKQPTDEYGFLTSEGRFVDREEGKIVAEGAGQVSPGMRRELLSSDVNWDAGLDRPKPPAMSRQQRRATERKLSKGRARL
jgi:hypothetical protein